MSKPKLQMPMGQVMYLGPRIQSIGLGYGAVWRDGIHPSIYPYIEACPSLGAMFVPIPEVGKVMRELNFDYAHNMKGTTGKYVTFYLTIQKWLTSLKQKQTSTIETKKTYA